ncbi:MAG: hypothetical protein GF308_21070 [Candidatus Heimdallarchaeota archaeon]|nr:hypothetical protein [Candidatus Heimdallarchaeota archaeon]
MNNQENHVECDSKNKPLPKNGDDEMTDPIEDAYEKYKLIGDTGTAVLEYLLLAQKGEEIKSSAVRDELNLTASNLSHAARRLEEGKLISRDKGYAPEIGTILAMLLRRLIRLEGRIDELEAKMG